MIDEAYEIFSRMSSEELNQYKNYCHCSECCDRSDCGGLYLFCEHFSVCVTDVILSML